MPEAAFRLEPKRRETAVIRSIAFRRLRRQKGESHAMQR